MRKIENYGLRLRAWNGWHIKLWPVVIMIIVLFVPSCKSITGTQQSEQKEAHRFTERLTGTLATIPIEKAPLIIPIRNLHNLPAGARFAAKEGRATAELEIKGDTLFITAICDSLQQLVFKYEKELAYQIDLNEKLQEKSEPAGNGFYSFLKGLPAVILLTIIAVLIIKYK